MSSGLWFRLGVLFSPGRLRGFWRVLTEHPEWKGSLWAKAAITARLIRGLVGILVGSRTVGKRRWALRLAICRRCPLYDERLRRCGTEDKPKLGCRCFTDYLALEERPYPGGCWAKEFAPNSGFGWD